MASDFRTGAIIKYNNENCMIIEHQHVTPGKGPAHHQVKLRNTRTGRIVEARFRPGEKVDYVRVERHNFQYLYNDGDVFYFMNTDNYEQVPVPREMIEDNIKYLKENQDVMIAFEGDEMLDVEMPPNVILMVTHTEPGLKGDTATNALKPATVETGAQVNVPLFINENDMIKVDTRSGDYMERVKL